MNDIKINYSFIKYIPAALIVLSAIRLEIYYACFNLSIFNFLSLTELLSSCFNHLLFVYLFIGLLIISINEIQNINFKEVMEIEKLSFKNIILILIFYYPRLIAIVLLTLIIPWICLLINDWYKIIILIILILTLIFYTLVIVLSFFKQNHLIDSGILFIGLILICTVIETYVEVDMTKNKYFYFNTKITLEEEALLLSDSTNTYIGKSENFIFFYDIINNYTKVVPIRLVKELNIIHNYPTDRKNNSAFKSKPLKKNHKYEF
jgi:hypothetical protein